MGVLRRKTWINIAATLLVVLAFFTCIANTAAAQQANQAAPGITAPNVAPDSTNGPGTLSKNLGISGYKATVFEVLTALGAMVAWLGGSLLDISIAVFTAGMKQTVDYLKFDEVIKQIWAVIRDVFNLLFIFGLIFAGFKIILDANDSASKRTVGMIVLAALLINFSLYAAQVVVDFTNVAAYQIHQLIAANDKSGTTIFGIPVPNTTDQFVTFSGINGTQNKDQAKALQDQVAKKTGQSSVNTIGSAIVLGLLFCIFYIILGFIFAACAVILFTRFFALVFLMIFSPLMFLGWVLPGMKQLSSQWWKYFSNQALVGPAMLFMIYLSLRALQGIGNTGQNGGIMGTTLYLLIVTAFLIASLKVAKSFGAYGSQMAMNVGNNLQGRARVLAGSATFGLAARGGRATLGRMAQSISERDGLRDAASRGGVRGWVARRTLDTTSAVGDASFDARKVGGVGKKLGIGTGAKGGYKTATEAVAKREKEYAKKLGTVSEDDPEIRKLKAELDFGEQSIKAQKAEVQRLRKSGTATPEEIEAAKARLEDMEDDQNDSKEKLEREKYRRQLGTVAPVGESAHLDEMVRQKKEAIKSDMALYVKMDDADPNKVFFKKRILENKKEQAELEKKRDKASGGYANALENANPVKKFFSGMNNAQRKNAAKEIRDEFKKKVKTKEKDKAKDKDKEPEKDKSKEEDK